MSDPLETYNRLMAEDHAIFRYDASGEWLECFEDLAAEVRALRKERDDERMAGHIHSKAADELAQTVARLRDENAGLEAQVAELERRLNPPCSDPSIDAFYLKSDELRGEP